MCALFSLHRKRKTSVNITEFNLESTVNSACKIGSETESTLDQSNYNKEAEGTSDIKVSIRNNLYESRAITHKYYYIIMIQIMVILVIQPIQLLSQKLHIYSQRFMPMKGNRLLYR